MAMVLINTHDSPCPQEYVVAVARSRTRTLGGTASTGFTGRLAGMLLVLVLLVLVGGAAFLATWDIPAPTATVEKVIPDERFRR